MAETEAKKQERIYEIPSLIPYFEGLQGERARCVVEEVEGLKRNYKGFPGLDNCWQFNTNTRCIEGSNLAHLVLANEVLGRDKLRTLTFQEGRKLDAQGKLTNGVYREFGLVVYSDGSPNESVAKQLAREAKRRKFAFPLIFHPSSLRLHNGSYALRGDDSLVLSGEEAQEELSYWDYVSNSGAHRLGRGRDGSWNADWDDLSGSGSDGRVDWIRGEAPLVEVIRVLAKNL